MFSEFGESVFEETSAFDEMQTLKENTSYLISTLDLEGLDVQYLDKAEERIQEECCPGGPYIVFRTEPSIPLLIIRDWKLRQNAFFYFKRYQLQTLK
jgi:leucyl-tRNA synthetase